MPLGTTLWLSKPKASAAVGLDRGKCGGDAFDDCHKFGFADRLGKVVVHPGSEAAFLVAG